MYGAAATVATDVNTGCVGLVNQGATCYQNSVIQQLFMHDGLRELVMHGPGATKEEGATDREKILFNLQRTFSFLHSSEMRFYNPKGFVNSTSALKLEHGHLSQNDAVGFLQNLLENLEENWAGFKEREELRRMITITTAITSVRRCPHKHQTERESRDPLCLLNIETSNPIGSLEKALESRFRFIGTVDELECEECFPEVGKEKKKNPRFDADQYEYIASLPPVCIFQLNRFNFDYENNVPIKLNHRVSFDKRIDLSRFMKECVMGGKTSEEDAVYNLKGVLVHHGSSANFGHYYSFIHDGKSDKWYRFDDERVTVFNVEEKLEEECFGGPVLSEGV